MRKRELAKKRNKMNKKFAEDQDDIDSANEEFEYDENLHSKHPFSIVQYVKHNKAQEKP